MFLKISGLNVYTKWSRSTTARQQDGLSYDIFIGVSIAKLVNSPQFRCNIQNPLPWFKYLTPLLWHHINKLWCIKSLSHPSLGWLYVFSSFQPPRPRPRPPPPPQWLLLLTSKPFELDLRYLGQRKYRSGKMFWMTFGWPWPKVTAVTFINTNLLVSRIKWEPLNQLLQNLVAIFLWSWLLPDEI